LQLQNSFLDLNIFKVSLDFDMATHRVVRKQHCQLFERFIHISRLENAFCCYCLGDNGNACIINTKWAVKN
jgi:hypothetical protein